MPQQQFARPPPPQAMPPQQFEFARPPPQQAMPPQQFARPPPQQAMPPQQFARQPPQQAMPPQQFARPPLQQALARGLSVREQLMASQRSRLRAGVGASDSAFAPEASITNHPGDQGETRVHGGSSEMESVYAVLQEFAASDYAKAICEYCNVSPSAWGQARDMFAEVRLVGGPGGPASTVVIVLSRAFEQRSEKLLERLKRHFRQRMPGQVQRLQYETKSPPSTKTYIV